ncbi:MAG: FemAB family PEP-CTERM system-associated protein, partial [Gammaproteobacteria bacterium]
RDVIKKTFGHDGYYLYAINKNGIVKGILPLILMKSRLFGKFFVSMPYFNYGGAIADHPDIELMLMEAADKHAATINVAHIEYRDDIARRQYPARENKVNMILPLPSCKQDLWESFTPKLRAQIKRPQRENIEIQHGGLDLLKDFYAVFARNMRDLGTPVYGKSFFYNILNAFPNESSILTISLEGKAVAAAFLLGYGDTLEIPWASSIRSVNHLSINMLMYWEVLSFAVNKGFKYFDFGRSSKDAGTYKFKKQWGASPKQLYWHYWLPPGEKMPSLNPHNPKFNLAINLWRRLPITLTKLIGPGIVKNLP